MSLNRKSTGIKPQLLVSIALVMFGVVYNWTTERMEHSGYHHGYLSLIVSIGVAGTLLIAGIRERTASVRFFYYFVCSGIPMILGSIYRYVAQRESDKRDLAKAGLS